MLNSFSLYRTRSATDSAAPSTDGVAASATNTYYSDVWKGATKWGLTVNTTGTLTGTWTLWEANKNHPDLTNDNDWVDMTAASEFVETNPSGATTKWSVNSVLLRGGVYRLKYVNTSGTGNLFARVTRNT